MNGRQRIRLTKAAAHETVESLIWKELHSPTHILDRYPEELHSKIRAEMELIRQRVEKRQRELEQ